MQYELFSGELAVVAPLPTKTLRLKSLRPIFKNEVIREDAPAWLSSKKRVTQAEDVFEMFRHLKDECKEQFIALHLDMKNTVICYEQVSVGSLNASIVHPREVWKGALLSSAGAIIVAHNHPSGDPTPSREDIELTKRLNECGELLGIRLLDHVIIGEDRFCSMKSSGQF